MTILHELESLIQAEKQVSPEPGSLGAGWQRLSADLGTNMPALDVSSAPIHLASVGLVGKISALVVTSGVVVGTAVVSLSSPTPLPAVPSVSVVVEQRAPKTLPSAFVGNAQPSVVVPDTQPSVSVGGVFPVPEALRATRAAVPPANAPRVQPLVARDAGTALDEELSLLSRAKHQMDVGRSDLAQVWLEQHKSRFPRGMLAIERDGLTVLLACQSKSDSSRELGRRFVRLHPNSPLIDRIIRACETNGEISK
jgi:hypothetical protein